jgi:tubulin--tyrosine ligase-like protein 12
MSENNDAGVYENFIALHEMQLRASGVPEQFWKSLNTKLSNQIFDAGEFFQLLLLDYGDEERGEKDAVFTVVTLKNIKAADPNAIFLIDHALTYKTDILRTQLTENPSLLNRLSIMMGLPVNDDIEKVMDNIWRFNNFYSINAQGKNEHLKIIALFNLTLYRCNCRRFLTFVVRYG